MIIQGSIKSYVQQLVYADGDLHQAVELDNDMAFERAKITELEDGEAAQDEEKDPNDEEKQIFKP